MLPSLFQKRLAGLDELQFTELVGRLLVAERVACGLRPEQFVYSLETKAKDEGLDAEATDVPDGASEVFPAGSSGFQFKAVKGYLSDLEIDKEVNKPGSRRILERGGTYVFVWSKDLNPKQLDDARAELEQQAQNVVANAKTAFWPASYIAQLCARYPAVPQDVGLVSYGPVQPVSRWLTSLQQAERPFFADKARDSAIGDIRARLEQSEGGLVARISGDSGVGKSRTVAEALDVEGLRDITFYAPTTEGISAFLNLVINDDYAEAILVVDEVAGEDLSGLQAQVEAAGRRIRLLTVGLAESQRVLPGRYDLELPPLDTEAMKKLISQQGVRESEAAFVAEATEGYPQMAFEILEEIRRDPEAADLSRLARTRRPRELMQRAVPDEFRTPLGVLALFRSVGCRAELEQQLDDIAAVFDVSRNDLATTIENAEGRYIRLAGRKCYVRPKLVATWLAGEILEREGDRIIEKLNALPGTLQDEFVGQLENFGEGPSTFKRVLGSFVEQSDRFRDPPTFDEAAGRFLRAAAAVAPKQVAEAINELVSKASDEELAVLPRRDLVWALEYLCWWEDTFPLAISGLFRLALHENEDWANNATGEFVDSFQVYLGGTLVPHHDRMEWLQGVLRDDESVEVARLAAKAAAAGLRTHHTRTSGVGRGRLEPADWHPTSVEELLTAHRESWSLLMELWDRAGGDDALRREVEELIAGNTRAAIAHGLIDEVERDIRAREWSSATRAELAAALRGVRRYDKPPDEFVVRLTGLLDFLGGSEFRERVDLLFQSKPWDLQEGEKHEEIPPAVRALGDEVVERPELLHEALAVASSAPDDGSRLPFFAYVAGKLGAKEVGQAALETNPPTWAAVAAAMSQADAQGHQDWADSVLAEAAERDDWLEVVPWLLQVMPLTHARLELALDLIARGRIRGRNLASLLYGARIRALERADAMALVRAVAEDDDEHALEAALGMFEQWLDDHESEASAVTEVAGFLAERGASVSEPSHNSMLTYYLGRLLRDVPLPFDAKADVWRRRVYESGISAPHEEHPLIYDLLDEDPERTTELVLGVLFEAAEKPYPRWAYSLEDFKLLSRLAEATSPETIWQRLAERSDDELRFLLRHTRWSGDRPDGLVRAFLVSERLEALSDEAAVNFFNSLGVVSGPYYLALERELERARRWLEDLKATTAEPWAKELVADYEQRVPAEKTREEEQDLHFR